MNILGSHVDSMSKVILGGNNQRTSATGEIQLFQPPDARPDDPGEQQRLASLAMQRTVRPLRIGRWSTPCATRGELRTRQAIRSTWQTPLDMLTNLWRAQHQMARLSGKQHGEQIQEMMLSTPARAFVGIMPADMSGVWPGESAGRPQILAPRRVLSSAIPGNNLTTPAVSQPGWPLSGDVLAGMDGAWSECVVNMRSTLR